MMRSPNWMLLLYMDDEDALGAVNSCLSTSDQEQERFEQLYYDPGEYPDTDVFGMVSDKLEKESVLSAFCSAQWYQPQKTYLGFHASDGGWEYWRLDRLKNSRNLK